MTEETAARALSAKDAVRVAEAYIAGTIGLADGIRSQGGWPANLIDRLRSGVYASERYTLRDRATAQQQFGTAEVDMIHLIALTAECAKLWKRSRVVYRVHPALADSLLESVNDETAIPCEILARLPHPDPFIAFPYEIPADVEPNPQFPLMSQPMYVGMLITGRTAHGDLVSTADPTLAVLDISVAARLQYRGQGPTYEEKTVRIPVDGKLTVEGMIYAHQERSGSPITEASEEDLQAFRLAVALLLYVCSTSSDVVRQPRPPAKRRSKTAHKQTTVLDVGFDVGPKLLAARRADAEANSDGEGAGRTVRPHLRRAHWHTYWTGPRSEPSPEVRWIHPVTVHGDKANPGRVTVIDVDPAPDSAR